MPRPLIIITVYMARLSPQEIRIPVLDGLGQVGGGDRLLPLQIRDGPGHPQNAVVAPGGEAHALESGLQNPLPDEAEAALRDGSSRIHALTDAFEKVDHIADETAKEVTATAETVKVIQNIALNTKILGFNASIEASRAKESGKGFGVIAQEVRSLAETSKGAADKIESAVKRIDEYSSGMRKEVVRTKDAVDQCLEELKVFSSLLNELKAMSAE